MKVFTSTGFQGHWPVPVALVVVADTPEEALRLAREKLAVHGLLDEKAAFGSGAYYNWQHFNVSDLDELDTATPGCDMLSDGNY